MICKWCIDYSPACQEPEFWKKVEGAGSVQEIKEEISFMEFDRISFPVVAAYFDKDERGNWNKREYPGDVETKLSSMSLGWNFTDGSATVEKLRSFWLGIG